MIIENLYLLIEIIATLLMLWALHGSKKRPGIYTIVYACIALIIVTAIAEGRISVNFNIFIHLGLILLNIFEFKDSIKNAIIYELLNILMISAIEYILGLMFIVIGHMDCLGSKELLILQMISICIVLIIFIKVNLKKMCDILLSHNIFVWVTLIGLGVTCIFFVLKYYLSDGFDLSVFVYNLILFAIPLFLLYEWQRENYMNKKKVEELEIFHQYNDVYKNLITDMRKKQHDFDNHIQAILSMNIVAKDLDSLIHQQNEYCQKLMDNNQDSIFLKENINSMFLGFIYMKKKYAEDLGIEVNYRFDCHDIEAKLSFMDFVTIVGNLFDNAVEAVKNESHKVIILHILQPTEDSVLIHVFNTYTFSEEEIPADFFSGRSKKGKEHGLGLTNVAEVVKRYHGIIQNTFDLIEEEKYYKISLQLLWEGEK